MSLQLSQRVRRINPSPTIAVTMRAAELRAAGRDVIALGVGEPDFDTPEFIKRAAIQAIQRGYTKYTPVGGTATLKQAVATKFKRDNGLDYTPNQILVSGGGKQSFYNLAQALLDPGDQVIIPTPYWVSYPAMVRLAEAEPLLITTDFDQHYKISPEQLDAAITPRTRMVVLNSPSNPSGMAYTAQELAALGEVFSAHPGVLIATDDMYEQIWWSDEPFCNIAMACPELLERIVILHGVSKVYAMTGWRIGYAAGPVEIITAMMKIQSQSTSNPCSVSQAAAETALLGDQSAITAMVERFHDRHDYVYQALAAMDGVRVHPSVGTFYSFPDFSAVIERMPGIDDDLALAEYLLEEAGVALVPGTAFGSSGSLRVSYAASRENLVKAMDRIGRALETSVSS